jgi:hypothetical protein
VNGTTSVSNHGRWLYGLRVPEFRRTVEATKDTVTWQIRVEKSCNMQNATDVLEPKLFIVGRLTP